MEPRREPQHLRAREQGVRPARAVLARPRHLDETRARARRDGRLRGQDRRQRLHVVELAHDQLRHAARDHAADPHADPDTHTDTDAGTDRSPGRASSERVGDDAQVERDSRRQQLRPRNKDRGARGSVHRCQRHLEHTAGRPRQHRALQRAHGRRRQRLVGGSGDHLPVHPAACRRPRRRSNRPATPSAPVGSNRASTRAGT